MSSSRVTIELRAVAELTTGYGRQVAFAPDGERWVSASPGAAHVWRGSEPIGRATVDSTATGRVRFSSDGNRLLLAPYSYDLARGAWLDQAALRDRLGPAGSEPDAFALAASAWDGDGDDLVVAARSSPRGASDAPGPREHVGVLHGAERARGDTLYAGDHEVRSIAIDDAFIATAGRDIAIWSRADHRQVAELSGHEVTVTELAFGGDGRWLGSLDGRGVLLIWDTSHWGGPVASINTSAESGLALAWHPLLPLIATGGYDGVVRLWATDGGDAPVCATTPLGGWVQGLAFDPSGTRLLAAANALPARIVMYEVDQGDPAADAHDDSQPASPGPKP